VQKIGAFGNTETLAAIVTDRQQHTNKIKVMVWLKCLTEHVCIHGISDKFGIYAFNFQHRKPPTA
jgi:hypothetical protein